MGVKEERRNGQELYGVEDFTYPEMPWTQEMAGLGERWGEVFPGIRKAGAPDQEEKTGESASEAYAPVSEERLLKLVAEERQKAEEHGRVQGIEQGRALGRDETSQHLETERRRLQAQAAALAESFVVAQRGYFHQAEQETVRLALAIAARILRREAQMDPLLLTGAMRVALGQLADSTTVRLRVPVEDQTLWEEAMALIPRLASRPQVVGDERLKLGDCQVETELGMANLGLWAQLKEIERGFFDRVGNAPMGEADRLRQQNDRQGSISVSAEFATDAMVGANK